MRRPRSNESHLNKRAKLSNTGFFDAQQHDSSFNLNIFNSPPSVTCLSPMMAIDSVSSIPIYGAQSPGSPTAVDPVWTSVYSPTPTPPELTHTTATPESATFENLQVEALPEAYALHLPENQLFARYYDFPSEASSASSGILLGKEGNSFPFEEFLNARLHLRAG